MSKLHDLEFELIKDTVSAHYGVEKDFMMGKGRKKINKELPARHMLVYILRKYKYMTYQEIGKLLNMCHSNVIYIYKKMNGYMDLYEDVANHRNEIISVLKNK